MESDLWGEVVELIGDPALFAKAALHPSIGSVYWRTGADLAPELLHHGEEGPPPGVYGRTDAPVKEAVRAGSETG